MKHKKVVCPSDETTIKTTRIITIPVNEVLEKLGLSQFKGCALYVQSSYTGVKQTPGYVQVHITIPEKDRNGKWKQP